ncbi:RNA polymerase sigma factor [Arthrobacter sp. TMN-37]
MARTGLSPAGARAEAVARASYGRLLALLAAPTGDIQAAEDALADAFLKALTVWPMAGIPEKPEAWLFTVARNRQRDRYRSAAHRTSVPLESDAGASAADSPGGTSPRAGSPGAVPSPVRPGSGVPGAVHWDEIDVGAIPDRRLALLFVCAHPAIDPGVRTPLMLQVVLGIPSERIASAFAVPAPAMAQRLVRAKRRIREARIPFVLPDTSVLQQRLPAVLEAVYGAYALDWRSALPGAGRVQAGGGPGEPAGTDAGARNPAGPDAGSQPETGADAGPPEGLASEALYLATVLAELLPAEPEVHGLAALICLSLARGPARTAPGGGFVPLARQDTALWDAELIARGEAHLRRASSFGRIGRFQLEAAMQSVHCDRARTGRTDWQALLRLHEALLARMPTLGGIVSLAAALGEASGPEAALSFLDAADAPALTEFQPAWATRAHLLAQAGRTAEAAEAYRRALALTGDPALRGYLEAALGSLPAPEPPLTDTNAERT